MPSLEERLVYFATIFIQPKGEHDRVIGVRGNLSVCTDKAGLILQKLSCVNDCVRKKFVRKLYVIFDRQLCRVFERYDRLISYTVITINLDKDDTYCAYCVRVYNRDSICSSQLDTRIDLKSLIFLKADLNYCFSFAVSLDIPRLNAIFSRAYRTREARTEVLKLPQWFSSIVTCAFDEPIDAHRRQESSYERFHRYKINSVCF